MSDKQAGHIEDWIRASGDPPDEMDAASKQTIAEHRALRDRLRRACGSIQPPAGMYERLTAALDLAESQPVPADRGGLFYRLPRRMLGAAAIAAALIAVVGLFWNTADPVAQAEFSRIHLSNLQRQNGQYHRGQDRQILRSRLQDAFQTVPIMPAFDPDEDRRYCGCAAARFFDRTVASYVVVLSGRRRVSVVMVDTPLEELGFTHPFTTEDGWEFAWCSHDGCKMAATRIGGHTYVAIGQDVSETELVELLTRVRQAADRQGGA
jgi:hypothetical protein